MPAPDKLMELMSKSQAEGQAEPSAAESAKGPVTSPMSTPQQSEGAKMAATAKIALAMKLFDQALVSFGAESKEGSALMDSISKLTKTFGIKMDEGEKLIPAELKMLVEAAGQKTPEMQAAQAGGPAGGAPQMKMAA